MIQFLRRQRLFTLALVLAFAAVFAGLAMLAGCGGTHESAPDPAPSVNQPGNGQRVFQNPHGFRNVAFSCNGTVGMYVTSAGSGDTLPSGVAVLAADPNCVK